MGTNYYVAENHCKCCDRYDETYHIGKSSYGWSFSFQGYKLEELVSWQAWKDFLKDKMIKDEHGITIPYDEFVTLIEGVKSPSFVRADGHKNLQHNEQGSLDKQGWFDPEYDWDDGEGYSFTSWEFS
jgi:hypothetical protein